MTITFNIEYGPAKNFENINSDHEWVSLNVGSTVEIYHSFEKWEGVYIVSKKTYFIIGNGFSYNLQLKSVHLECIENGHNKEWNAKVKDDFSVLVTWGKIGRTLQGKTFKHSSMSQAQQFVKEKIEQKLKKGYKK